MTDFDQMSGVEFEKYIWAFLSQKGYRVYETKKSYDFGVNLIVYARNNKTVVQVKRYKSKVGIKAVQEIISGKVFYDAKNAIVITNSYYTEPAKKLAGKSKVKLYDRNDLKEFVY